MGSFWPKRLPELRKDRKAFALLLSWCTGMSSRKRLQWLASEINAGRSAFVTFSYNAFTRREKVKFTLERSYGVAGMSRPCVMGALLAVQTACITSVSTDKGHTSSDGRTVVEFWVQQVFDASEDEAVPSSCSLENSEVLPNIAVPEVCGKTSDPDAFPAFTKDESITHADSVVGTLNGDSRVRGSHVGSDGIFSAPSNSPVTTDSLPCRICSGSGQYGFSSCVFCHGTGRDDSATSVDLAGPGLRSPVLPSRRVFTEKQLAVFPVACQFQTFLMVQRLNVCLGGPRFLVFIPKRLCVMAEMLPPMFPP